MHINELNVHLRAMIADSHETFLIGQALAEMAVRERAHLAEMIAKGEGDCGDNYACEFAQLAQIEDMAKTFSDFIAMQDEIV